MAEENTTTEEKDSTAAAPEEVGTPVAEKSTARAPRNTDAGAERRKRRAPRKSARPRSEFDQKIIDIRRVTRVVAGGRRFSFSVSLVAGDRKGNVGVGIGKASDTSLAIEKAARNAKKNMIKLPLTKDRRIPHDIEAKYCASHVWLSPAPGKGLVAGSSVRTVLELGGVKDVNAKVYSRSKNKLNNARAALKALDGLKN